MGLTTKTLSHKCAFQKIRLSVYCIVLMVAPGFLFANNNAVFLTLGYPGTTGLYYERTINHVVIGGSPGLLFPLLTLNNPSYNPDLYAGYSVFGNSWFRATINFHIMYFYKYDVLYLASLGSEGTQNIRGDLILLGPDAECRFYYRYFFAQLQFGMRSTYHKWYGDSPENNFLFYKLMPALGFSAGVKF
jgi:hypothetical protein